MLDTIPRQPGSYAFAEKWTNKLVAKVVFLATLGRSSVAVGQATGLDPEAIRTMLHRWDVALPDGEVRTLIPLNNRLRYALAWLAAREGLTPEEWASRVVIAAIKDGVAGA